MPLRPDTGFFAQLRHAFLVGRQRVGDGWFEQFGHDIGKLATDPRCGKLIPVIVQSLQFLRRPLARLQQFRRGGDKAGVGLGFFRPIVSRKVLAGIVNRIALCKSRHGPKRRVTLPSTGSKSTQAP